MFEHITASEVAGYGVGTLLLCATLSATKIDSFIASSQRSSVGMCKRCGDLKLIACSRCKGSGLINEGQPGQFIFNLVGGGDSSSSSSQQAFRDKPTKTIVKKSLSCIKCQAKGHFCCPICSIQSDI